jgi:hypothetical protein
MAGSVVGSAGERDSMGVGAGLDVGLGAGVTLAVGVAAAVGATVGVGTPSAPTLQAAMEVAMARRAKMRLGRFIGRLLCVRASETRVAAVRLSHIAAV